MKPFLKEVARDLFEKLKGDFTRVALVFPNKRASLFFNEHLMEMAERPVWSPAYISIRQLFETTSRKKTAEPVTLVCLLYKSFVQATGSTESLDDFYYWGELLLNDFDDADKNMVDTRALFANLAELHAITDNYDFLDEGQREALKLFFKNFSPDKKTELKRRFTELWNKLGVIYSDFRQRLDERELAYEGMLYREVIEHLDVSRLPYDKYVFVGFNALNKVEYRMFKALKDAGKALFYWDYDVYYLDKQPHEAGEFIRRNLSEFPSELPSTCFDHLSQLKDITFVRSATDNAEARYLTQWIKEELTEEEKQTAVVLCNENLLQPVLHSIPETVQHTNVTMGFPMQQTPVFSYVTAVLDLHTEGWRGSNKRFAYRQTGTVLRHPYTAMISEQAVELDVELRTGNRLYSASEDLQRDEMLKTIFSPPEDNIALCEKLRSLLKSVASAYETKPDKTADTFDQLYKESLFRAYTIVNRFIDLLHTGDLTVERATLARLIKRACATTNVPFHGEPAAGLQVMGVLETRNLDFKHIILLSVNEGQLPKSAVDSSFIPYNLRKAFGMTTVEHKMAVFAYYFYRMIQRAEHVTLVYNNTATSLSRGEQSRFMLQLLVDYPHAIRQLQLSPRQNPLQHEEKEIVKTPEMIKDLIADYEYKDDTPRGALSPSALNIYIDCPAKFFYRYVAKLKVEDDVSEDIDAAQFGTIFHKVAENVYKDLAAQSPLITHERIKELLRNELLLQKYVDDAFRTEFFKLKDAKTHIEYNGLQLINSAVVLRYVKQLLRVDAEHTPFTYIGSEQEVYEAFPIIIDGKEFSLKIGGIIDRMDMKEDTLRIIDYKTGGKSGNLQEIDKLFIDSLQRPYHILQTFMYAAIMAKKERASGQKRKIAPSLLYIHEAKADAYSPVIRMKGEPVLDFSPYEDEVREGITDLLRQLLDVETPFCRTDIKEHCTYCDYKKLCKR